jgi:hypothetical protein
MRGEISRPGEGTRRGLETARGEARRGDGSRSGEARVRGK